MEEPRALQQLYKDISAVNSNAAVDTLIRTLAAFPDQLWVFDDSLNVVFSNEFAVQGSLGCEPGAILEDFPPGLQPLIKRGVRQCLDQHSNATIDEQVPVGKRGESRYSMMFLPLTDRFAACTVRELTDPEEIIESLRDREAKLSAVLDAIPDVMFRFNSEGIFIDCWTADTSLLLMPPGEFIGHHVTERMPPQISQLTIDNIALTLTSGELQSYEYSLVINGQLTTWEARMVKSGPSEVLAIARNITESKAIEKELLKQREFFRKVIDLDPNFVFVKNRQGQFALANQAVANVYGTTIESLIGKTDADFNSNLEEVEAFLRDDLAVMDSGQTKIIPEERITDATNKVRYLRTAKVPVADDDGQINHLLGVSNDITESKLALEKLCKSEEKYRELVDNMSEGMLLVDINKDIQFANPAAERIFGVEPSCLVGRNWREFTTPQQYTAVSSQMDEQRAGRSGTYIIAIKRPDGTRRTLRISASPRLDAEGNFLGSFGPVRDITDQIKLENHLHQSQKLEAIGALAGGIAHDFNNLLFAMLANTEIALSELPADSNIRQSLVEVVHAGKHAKELVKQILSFARQSEPSPGPIQTTQVIKEVLSLLRASFPATIEIQHSIDSPPVMVLAGPTQIHQVLLNLCMNARQAMPEDNGVLRIAVKHIEIGVEVQIPGTALPAGRYLSIEVQDNGCGIETDDLKRIFDPFFTTKGVGEGTGMGLAVVHGIITALNGSITVDSRIGFGSTFTVYLPIIEEVPADVQPTSEYQAPLGNENILIVDDDEIIARAIGKVLKRLGYRVTVLTNSRDALALIKEKPMSIDLLVTDQTMPHLTGIEVAAEAKSTRPNLPIILCSGYSDVVSSEDTAAYGIDEYLVKPFEAADLADTIRRLLDQKKNTAAKARDAAH